MPLLNPRGAIYLLAMLMALGLAYDLMRVPIQVSDSLTELLEVQQSPSLLATARETAQRGGYMRPLRLVQIKALFDMAEGHYRLVYRGFHALLLIVALFLFTRAMRVHTWTDFAAGTFALTVLTGMHTFRGTVREAFPINHFLEIVVFCLIALNLAQSRPRWWVDLAAAGTFIVASLTLESGLLVWVVLITAWAYGMRGVSRGGQIAVTGLLAAYFVVRFFYFANGIPGLAERSSGFLLDILEPNELEQRFGANPIWFSCYNVTTSILSVLFSDPDGGVFEIARAWLRGDVPPRLYVSLASSVLATALIVWTAAARWRAGSLGDGRGTMLLVFAAVLFANAAMSYAYTKHEVISVAGVFYALAAYVGGCQLLEWMQTRPHGAMRSLAVVMIAATASIWAFRSAGVHHMIRQQAFKQRNDWVDVAAPPDVTSIQGRRAAALIRELRHEAFEMRVTNPYLLPRWMDRWWGE